MDKQWQLATILTITSTRIGFPSKIQARTLRAQVGAGILGRYHIELKGMNALSLFQRDDHHSKKLSGLLTNESSPTT
jgi:hypothetical protein